MATTYSTRYYNSDGSVKQPPPSASTLGLQSTPINETIATTVIDGVGDRHFLFPLPVQGVRKLLYWLRKSGDMDTGGPTLDADIVLIWTLLGVEQTAVVVYDSSANLPFSAAVTALELFEPNLDLTPYKAADGGYVHIAFLTNTAATTPAAVNLTLIPFYQ